MIIKKSGFADIVGIPKEQFSKRTVEAVFNEELQ